MDFLPLVELVVSSAPKVGPCCRSGNRDPIVDVRQHDAVASKISGHTLGWRGPYLLAAEGSYFHERRGAWCGDD
jgi:hypothetical protein